jgi:hypothetical protein
MKTETKITRATIKARRDETAKAKCLAAIINKPGITSAELPMHLRRWLRQLKKDDGLIYYDERDNGWRVKQGIAVLPEPESKLTRDAGDHSAEALELAAKNFVHVRNDWCECKAGGPEQQIAYYRSKASGAHGWACCKCLGIVQTG